MKASRHKVYQSLGLRCSKVPGCALKPMLLLFRACCSTPSVMGSLERAFEPRFAVQESHASSESSYGCFLKMVVSRSCRKLSVSLGTQMIA